MTQISSAVWRRLDVDGHDTCILSRLDDGWRLSGAAVFPHEGARAHISYRVDCAIDWSTRSASYSGKVGDQAVTADIVRSRDAWAVNGVSLPQFGGLIDIDFGFTPATNFILMKRLAFPLNEPVSVAVAWFDVGEKTLTHLPQRYTRRGPAQFWYESPTVNYEGLLILAANGFVQTYPGLWELEAHE